MWKYFIVWGCVYVLTASSAQAQTVVTLPNGATILVNIQAMAVSIPPQCEIKFCDSDDLDCDGVLDQGCPGLEYDVCVDGSISDSYREAAYSGFCITPVVHECVPGELVISPSNCEQ